MIFVPELMLKILQFPIEGLDWIRMLGVVTTIVAYYYWRLAADGVELFARYSAQMRLFIPLVFVAMVLAFDMNPIYIALTAGDFAGGLWTWSALRKQGMPLLG